MKALPDSAASHGYDRWSVEAELLATLNELLDFTRRQLLSVWVDKKTQRELRQIPALEIPRPESVRPKKKSAWVEFARGLARKVGG